MTRRGFASRIRLGLAVLACVGFLGMATQARAGGTVLVMPSYFVTDQQYDANGDKVSLGADVKVPNLGFAVDYNGPIKGVLPDDWKPAVGVTVLFFLVDVKVAPLVGPEQSSGFKPAFLWPIVYLDSKYLNLSAGFEIDLGPEPSADHPITNTDRSHALTLGGTLKYPMGDLALSAGVDYILTFKRTTLGVEKNPPNWLIVRGMGLYSFPISGGVKGSVGAMIAYYFYSKDDAPDSGHHFLIRPQAGISYDRFSFTVTWGNVDEYTSGGISFSGKNQLVKSAKGFRAFLGYSF
jgi:hypothetical protein